MLKDVGGLLVDAGTVALPPGSDVADLQGSMDGRDVLAVGADQKAHWVSVDHPGAYALIGTASLPRPVSLAGNGSASIAGSGRAAVRSVTGVMSFERVEAGLGPVSMLELSGINSVQVLADGQVLILRQAGPSSALSIWNVDDGGVSDVSVNFRKPVFQMRRLCGSAGTFMVMTNQGDELMLLTLADDLSSAVATRLATAPRDDQFEGLATAPCPQ